MIYNQDYPFWLISVHALLFANGFRISKIDNSIVHIWTGFSSGTQGRSTVGIIYIYQAWEFPAVLKHFTSLVGRPFLVVNHWAYISLEVSDPKLTICFSHNRLASTCSLNDNSNWEFLQKSSKYSNTKHRYRLTTSRFLLMPLSILHCISAIRWQPCHIPFDSFFHCSFKFPVLHTFIPLEFQRARVSASFKWICKVCTSRCSQCS